jgi:hypothetical protein
MTEEYTIAKSFNLTEERAHELIQKYATHPFKRYLVREISSGEFLSTFIDIEELTTNEKCFLTSHCTSAAMLAQQEAQRKQKIAELVAAGIL